MAPSGYSDPEIAAIVAYLRNMTRVDSGAASIGDAARGRELFFGKGECNRCHRVGAEGPRAAPDLSSVGTLRTAATLQRALVDPSDALIPINRPVRAVLRDGTVVTGRRLNEDTHTRCSSSTSASDWCRSTRRRCASTRSRTTPKMPSYENMLNDAERADLVAYLLSLQGGELMLRRILAAALLVLAVCGVRIQAQVTFERLLNPSAEPQNWLTYSGGYSSQRHSQLEQIRPSNVDELELNGCFKRSRSRASRPRRSSSTA